MTYSHTLSDGHNDFAILIRVLYNNKIYDGSFAELFEEGGLPGHVDVPRLKAGQNGGAFWSVFWECPKNASDFSDSTYAEGWWHACPIDALLICS